MDPKVERLKAIIKGVKLRPTFGTDPSDPWSTKYNVTEWRQDALLIRYLKSKGIDPRYVSQQTMIGHSKSGEFAKWKRDHMTEAVDKKDTVTMDIPLLIRMLELAREDLKSDADLHRVIEKMIEIRNKGVLTMDDYDYVSKLKESLNVTDDMYEMLDEDLRKWFSKTHPEGDWKRINAKGEVVGPCAREPGEPKPKCMSKEKRAQLSKSERAAAVAAKRKHDPVADRPGKGGKPVNVSNYGKGKLGEETVDEACWDTHKQVGMKKKGDKMVPDCVPKNEEVEHLEEKNKPTNPKLWSRAKALARSKFDVYPSAYANGWASKWYKSKGGGWRSANEEVEQTNEAKKFGYAAISDRYKKITGSSLEDRAKHYADLEAKFKKQLADYQAQNKKEKETVKEDKFQDSYAATQTVGMELENGVSNRKKEMSKSARMIKALYKKHKMSEDMFDHEKENKSVASYGKKQKEEVPGSDKPKAAMVMKGGKTMTGQPRDTVEVDPQMNVKPGLVGTTKVGNR